MMAFLGGKAPLSPEPSLFLRSFEDALLVSGDSAGFSSNRHALRARPFFSFPLNKTSSLIGHEQSTFENEIRPPRNSSLLLFYIYKEDQQPLKSQGSGPLQITSLSFVEFVSCVVATDTLALYGSLLLSSLL